VAVIDTAKDKVVKKINTATKKGEKALGLSAQPFWWFKH
jgi:hypothetical protein